MLLVEGIVGHLSEAITSFLKPSCHLSFSDLAFHIYTAVPPCASYLSFEVLDKWLAWDHKKGEFRR